MNQDKAKGKAATPMRSASPKAASAPEPPKAERSVDSKKPKPEWAAGLRQLYDSVVNEPLPDSFADLISKLDDNSK